MTTRPRPVPTSEQRPAPDTTARLESVEHTQSLMMDKLDGIKADLRTLQRNENDINDRFTRLNERDDKLAATFREMQTSFTDALAKESADNKAALNKIVETVVDAVRAATLKSIGEQIVRWVFTVGGGGLLLGASYFWAHMK